MAAASSSKATVDEDLYEVEKILDVRTTANNVKEYKVRWAGWAPEHDTWEPEDNLLTCQDLVEKFLSTRQNVEVEKNSKSKNAVVEKKETKKKAVPAASNNRNDKASAKERAIEEFSPTTAPAPKTDQSTKSKQSNIDTAAIDISQSSSNADSSTSSTAGNKRKRPRNAQSKFWEMVPEVAANTLRDPFWKNLEEGKVDLGDGGLYERVKRNRRNAAGESPPTPFVDRKRQRRGRKPKNLPAAEAEESFGSSRDGDESMAEQQMRESLMEEDPNIAKETVEGDEAAEEKIEEEAAAKPDRRKRIEDDQGQTIGQSEDSAAVKKDETPAAANGEETPETKEEVDKGESGQIKRDTADSGADAIDVYPAAEQKLPDSSDDAIAEPEEAATERKTEAEDGGEAAEDASMISQADVTKNDLKQEAGAPKEQPPATTSVIEEITIDDNEETPPAVKTAALPKDRLMAVCKVLAEEATKLLVQGASAQKKKEPETTAPPEISPAVSAPPPVVTIDAQTSPVTPSQISPTGRSSTFLFGGQWRPMKRDSVSKPDSKLVIEEAQPVSDKPSTSSGASADPTMKLINAWTARLSSSDKNGQANGNAVHDAPMPSPFSSSAALPSSAEDASAPEEITVPGLPMPITTNLSLSAFFKAELRRPPQPPPGKLRRITTFADFEQACCNGEVETVRHALASKSVYGNAIDVNGRNPISGNPLMMQVCLLACDPSHLLDDIIDLLSSNGANLNSRNESGDTALTMAISRNQVCKVTKLLALGAAINLPNNAGETPLMLACKKNFPGIVFRLLEYGADFNAQSGEGKTALDIAKEMTAGGGSNACEMTLRDRSEKVMQTFDNALRLVVPPQNFEVIRPLFPLHCYALNESTAFRIVFYLEKHPPKPSPKTVFMLAIAKARFASLQQAEVRFWGTTPVKTVTLNGVEQAPVTSDGRFLYSMWPMRKGLNDLVISCNSDCKQSQHKLLIHAFAFRILGM